MRPFFDKTEEIVVMTKRKAAIIAGIVLIVLLAGWLIAAKNSDSIAISLADGKAGSTDVQIITHAWDGINGEYKVIRTETNDEGSRPMLLHLKKNALGFWTAERVKTAAPDGLWASIGWFEDTEGYVGVSDAVHIVYAGNNAVKKIEFDESELPRGVAVNVSQFDNSYVVHLVSYDTELLDGSVENLLAGMVE